MTPFRLARLAALAALATLLPHTGTAGAQSLAWLGSAEMSGGRYIFAERTYQFAATNGVVARFGPLSLGAGIPVLVRNSGALTYVGRIAAPTGGADHGTVARRRDGTTIPGGRRGQTSGLALPLSMSTAAQAAMAGDSTVAAAGDYSVAVGDPMASASFIMRRGAVLRSLGLDVAVKVPRTGVAAGIGTGEWDYGAGMSLDVAPGGALAQVSAAWWHYGDLPQLELKDGLQYSAGIGAAIGARAIWMASVSGASALFATADAPALAGLSLTWFAGGQRPVTLFAGTGLTESSPDFSASVGWSIPLAREQAPTIAARRSGNPNRNQRSTSPERIP